MCSPALRRQVHRKNVPGCECCVSHAQSAGGGGGWKTTGDCPQHPVSPSLLGSFVAGCFLRDSPLNPQNSGGGSSSKDTRVQKPTTYPTLGCREDTHRPHSNPQGGDGPRASPAPSLLFSGAEMLLPPPDFIVSAYTRPCRTLRPRPLRS